MMKVIIHTKIPPRPDWGLLGMAVEGWRGFHSDSGDAALGRDVDESRSCAAGAGRRRRTDCYSCQLRERVDHIFAVTYSDRRFAVMGSGWWNDYEGHVVEKEVFEKQMLGLLS